MVLGDVTVCIECILFTITQGQSDGTLHYLVQAKLAVLNKQFKQAEAILLERVSPPTKTTTCYRLMCPCNNVTG